MRRRAFLGTALWGLGALRRGAGFLWSCQSADGGWHSETYGLLRSGQSLTPLVVNALLDAGARADDSRIVRAVRFMEQEAGRPSDDYPCYAAALALRAFVRTGQGRTAPLIEWLESQQMSPANGWKKADREFGAWGIGGAPRRAPHAGHIDISMTRHVLEALAEAGVPPQAAAMRHALVFVTRCQNADGGFYFSTTETGANKAGETGDGFASYGTATADGLLCQIAAGCEDYQPALRWLQSNDKPGLPAGFPGAARARYAEGLRYYYADAATRAFRAAGARRAVPYVTALHKQQRADGSWKNAESLVKEDDPLIATAFAVSALALS